jgi:predicted histone-like DNA-binding protein
MPLIYKLVKCTRKGNSATNKFFAHAVMTETVSTEKLAQEMQNNCTVKLADIKAVLAELAETMKIKLQNSMRVHLDGLGSFKLGVRSIGVADEKTFNANANIKSVHINFQPATTMHHVGSVKDAKTGALKSKSVRIKTMADGVSYTNAATLVAPAAAAAVVNP